MIFPSSLAAAIAAEARRSTAFPCQAGLSGGPQAPNDRRDHDRFLESETTMSEGAVAADQLRLFIERIERLEEEKKGIADDVKDVYAEAKSTGFDTKTMRAIVRLRKLEAHTRQEMDALLETYRTALGLA